MKNLNKIFIVFLLLTLFIGYAVLISFVLSFWSGYPQGGDAFAHSLKIFWIAKYFPHHNWWNVWTAGMPLFVYYPVLQPFILAIFTAVFGFSPELVLSAAIVVSVGLTGMFIGLLVYDYSENIFSAILSSFICISCPVLWVVAAFYGSYARVTAMFLLAGSLYFTDKLANFPKKKAYLFLTIIFLVLAYYFHTLVGLLSSLIVALLLIIRIEGLKERLATLIKIFTPLALLIVIYYLPLRFFSSPSNYKIGLENFDIDKVIFIPLGDILGFWPGPVGGADALRTFSSLTPFVIPLLAVFLFMALLFKRQIFWNRTFLALLLGALGALIFANIKVNNPVFIAAYGTLAPVAGLFFVTIFAASATGILIPKVLGRWAGSLVSLVIILLLNFWLWIFFKPEPNLWRNEIYAKPISGGWQNLIEAVKTAGSTQFRFGTDSEASLAMVFNRIYPEYPQTRDHFANGILNDDFNFYLVKAVWDWEENPHETKFLLDWWSVDKFLVKGSADFPKYKNFDLFKDLGGFKIYRFNEVSPILSSTNAPAVYFIGKRQSYMVFFRALAQGDIDSNQIIPVWSGVENLAGLDLARLKNFPVVFLYDFSGEIREAELAILKKYVEGGGHLVIDGPRENRAGLTEPFPMNAISRQEAKDKWNFEIQDPSINANFESFSPPVYENGSWGIGEAKGVATWAKTLVSESGRPVIVGGDLGQGKVIWLGLNLPYHADNYKNWEEAQLLRNLVEWSLGRVEPAKTAYQVEFANPEERRVLLESPAKGILFKEVFFPSWKAYQGKKGLEIYKAGPDFMYIPLSDIKGKETVEITFQKTFVEIVSAAISIFTLIALIFWLFDWWIFAPQMQNLIKKLGNLSRFYRSWWSKEDET